MANENHSPSLESEKVLESTIRAAARLMCQTALELIEADPHQWSERPCSTCQTISTLIGRPFGCSRKFNPSIIYGVNPTD
jgi:hypothetical protein